MSRSSFPMYYANHFYIISFNLKNIVVEIIENKIGEDIDFDYDGRPQCLVCKFLYLQSRLDIFYFMLLIDRTNISARKPLLVNSTTQPKKEQVYK